MRSCVMVLKIGGSVLESERSHTRAVHEVYRWRREGVFVVAVVSAFAGETDRLLARARELGAGAWSVAAAAANGEHLSASLLGASLDRAGVPCAVLAPASLALTAEGDPLESEPVSVDRARLEQALERHGTVVVPGFAGVDRWGRTVLLGRGGSDLTALFLADGLGARCRLIKDVDGLYEWDPARAGARPRRFEQATFDDALATDGKILQHRAVRFAKERRLAFEVARLGGADATQVGAGPTRLVPPSLRSRPLRVALLGAGTVGGGVWLLARELSNELEIVAVACRDGRRARELGVPDERISTDPATLASGSPSEGELDVVVECLGGLEPARTAVAAALASGLHVVTANKAVLARHGPSLRELARENGVRLLASAAVGGSAPVLEWLGRCNGSARGVRGVLNGTVNHVLERLGEGWALDSALEEARALGLAEADASSDLDGRDAADKLAVVAASLGVERLSIPREGLDEGTAYRARRARGRGRRLRQIAELALVDGGTRARVALEELAPDDPLFDLPGSSNAALILGPNGPLDRPDGLGAGRWPTAESVLGDLLELARAHRGGRFILPLPEPRIV